MKLENSKGFSLLELLIVILIIGLIAAIALPKYRIISERVKMTEAVTLLATIASAQERFYMIHNRYAYAHEMAELDIEIPGKIKTDMYGRIETDFFIYSPDGDNGTPSHPIPDGRKAQAQRKPFGQKYQLYLDSKNRLRCQLNDKITHAQKTLCNQVNATGHL